ncbi:MAG: DUF5327 family protein [Bacillus sp. (in: firmicutes)]
MEISSEKVLNKMEGLIQQAKTAETREEMSRYISSIQILCELLAEAESVYEKKELPRVVQETKTNLQASIESGTGQIVKIDNANGTSLLDF